MITLLVLIIFVYLCYNIWAKKRFDASFEFNMFLTLAAALITFMSTGLVFCFISEKFYVETGREECYVKIYSLKNVDGIEGRFCLGSGYINSREYYYMYEQYNDGGLHRFETMAGNTIIYQNENNTPYLHWQKIHSRLPYWAHIYPRLFGYLPTKDTMYDVHIPTNSLILKYEVR